MTDFAKIYQKQSFRLTQFLKNMLYCCDETFCKNWVKYDTKQSNN